MAREYNLRRQEFLVLYRYENPDGGIVWLPVTKKFPTIVDADKWISENIRRLKALDCMTADPVEMPVEYRIEQLDVILVNSWEISP